ncbi:ABC transporter ATP-binding protein [Candidatus Woesebacteria bacterium]|nr:ABC transporter ATP-binding protein [Candidatus Woesebacteria bacterium]
MRDNKFPVIEFINVSKRFNSKAILSKINLTIYRGEIVGLTGPIGAGKTTFVQVALGLIVPDTGSVQLIGLPLEPNRQTLLQKINFASSSLRLNGYSTVMENLLTFARLYGVENPKEKILKLAKQFHVQHLLDSGSKVYKLSSGENSTVNLCKALLNNPTILFFDEITAHMDPTGTKRFTRYLTERKKMNETTVIISQNLAELQATCDRVIFMKHGKVMNIYSKDQLKHLQNIYD